MEIDKEPYPDYDPDYNWNTPTEPPKKRAFSGKSWKE